ncbi:MAG: cysteine desulfurase NifS, partial [Deltaproteobacteria bacterium]
GSACSSGSLSPSHVLRAMGLPEGRVGSAIRFSLGRGNTLEEIEYTVARLEEIVARVRAVASSAEGGARETRPFEEVP